MKIRVGHQPVYRFTAVNASGNELKMDASPEIGGENTGFRPMETLLAGLGGCSGIDVVNLLRKKKQDFTSFNVEVTAEREAGQVPALFKTIGVDFFIEGENIQPEKITSSVELSMQKYCSVAKTLEKTAQINYAVYVNGEKIHEVQP
jgi:putative redox protein